MYCIASTVLAVLVVLLPLMNRPNYFSASIAISNNSACLLILANMCLIITLLFGKFIQVIFFGELHMLEADRLYESAWYAISESIIILPHFRDDARIELCVFFGILIFFRIFHLICADRIDIIFQTNRGLFNHVRLSSAIILLASLDWCLVRYCVMAFRASSDSDSNSIVVPLFSFESLLLLNSMCNTAGKYIVNIVEARYLNQHEDEDIWESKSLYVFYLDVISKTTRLLAYATLFFLVLLPHHLILLHIIRDFYLTLKSLISTIHSHIQARQAKRQIETVVRNATAEELAHADDVCIICREEMTVEEGQPERMVPKKLLCSHIIHKGCLKSWLERSQRCPTCRRSVMNGALPDAPTAFGFGIPGFNNNDGNQQQPLNQEPGQLPRDHARGATPTQPNNNEATQGFSAAEGGDNAGSSTSNIGYTERRLGYETTLMALKNQLELPDGFQLPEGWGVVEARETLEGELQFELNQDNWVNILPNVESSVYSESSSLHPDTPKSDPSNSSSTPDPLSNTSYQNTNDRDGPLFFRDKGKFARTTTQSGNTPTNQSIPVSNRDVPSPTPTVPASASEYKQIPVRSLLDLDFEPSNESAPALSLSPDSTTEFGLQERNPTQDQKLEIINPSGPAEYPSVSNSPSLNDEPKDDE